MEMTQQIAGYTVHAKLVIARRRHPHAGCDAGGNQRLAAYVGAARDANNRAYGALMDEVDRTPARIIDRFLTHFIAMTWDLPGGGVPWGYVQDALARSTRIISTLKARQTLKPDALACAAIVIACALEATRGWSQITATVEDPRYNTTAQWSSWEGGFLRWLMKWSMNGHLTAYTADQRHTRVDVARRIREVKEIFLPSFERQIGEEFTDQIWNDIMGVGGPTNFKALMQLDQHQSLADTVLSRLLLLVQAGDLAMNANPGQIFTLLDRSFFVHPRCLSLCVNGIGDAYDADALHDLLHRGGHASSVARFVIAPAHGRAIQLSGFYVSNEALRQQAERLEVTGELERTSPWLRAELPLFDGTIGGRDG